MNTLVQDEMMQEEAFEVGGAPLSNPMEGSDWNAGYAFREGEGEGEGEGLRERATHEALTTAP